MNSLQFLTIPKTAELLSRKPWSVYRLIKTGELPSVTIGGRLRVPAVALEKMVADAMRATQETE